MGVYLEYFQKSKVFLYPLLQIKKGITHVPIQTYVAWDNVYSVNDHKFFCEYKTKKTKVFNKFAADNLINNPLFEEAIELNESTQLYIYDFSSFKTDIKRFINDKYAETLGVSIKSIEDVYEVCTPPDLEKETLIDNNHVINQLLKNSSISLTNK